jgi:hypothetical protein
MVGARPFGRSVTLGPVAIKKRGQGSPPDRMRTGFEEVAAGNIPAEFAMKIHEYYSSR